MIHMYCSLQSRRLRSPEAHSHAPPITTIVHAAHQMAAYSCWFGIFFEGWEGGVCLLNGSPQACKLTFTTGIISWSIALIGVLGTFRETNISPRWSKRVSFLDMVCASSSVSVRAVLCWVLSSL